jgi:hypothetical protein
MARANISGAVLDSAWGEQEKLISEGLAADVSIRLMSRVEAECPRLFYLDIAEDGMLLHDRGGFFAGIVEKVRERIRELGATRLRWGKVRFWDLKPDLRPGEVFEIW